MSTTSSRDAQGVSRAVRLAAGVLIGVPLLCATVPAVAQDAQGDQLPLARVALIDANRIYADSLLGKSYSARVEKLQEEIKTAQQAKEAEAARRRAELTTLSEELQNQSNTLSPEARDNKTREIRTKERDLQAFVEDGNAEIQRMQQRMQQQMQELHNEYRGKMRPHIEAVARQKGIDFLLDSTVALTLNPVFDISKDVVTHADAAETAGDAQP